MVNLYPPLLVLHSALRWCVVLSCSVLLVHSVLALWRYRTAVKRGGLFSRVFVGIVDLQFAVGLTLYTLASPIAALAREAPTQVLQQPSLRFFGLLHPLAAVAVFMIAHVMSVGARRAKIPHDQHMFYCVGSSICLFVLALMIPWPFTENGRPWFRGVLP
jgi:hypothetical protein